jgi:tetratricopeptide (TPR) repeat protein
VPLLIRRYRLARLANPFGHQTHIDLLHPTRTAFAKNWPDCRLQTAEQYLLKLSREDDLPGYLIPQVWAGYLRYGETRGVRGIVEHNRVDLLSLVALVAVLARVYAEPGHRYADPLAIARAHRRSGSETAALVHLQEQVAVLSDQALLELAWLYARSCQWEEAVAIWQRLVGNGSLQAMERLAKFYEHRRRDYEAALAYSQALISRDSNSAAHQQRLARVRAKVAKLLKRDITFPDTAL